MKSISDNGIPFFAKGQLRYNPVLVFFSQCTESNWYPLKFGENEGTKMKDLVG
jgi:hypothetical protein